MEDHSTQSVSICTHRHRVKPALFVIHHYYYLVTNTAGEGESILYQSLRKMPVTGIANSLLCVQIAHRTCENRAVGISILGIRIKALSAAISKGHPLLYYRAFSYLGVSSIDVVLTK